MLSDEAIFIIALMTAAGKTELFVPNELIEGFAPNVIVTRQEDLMRDGTWFRLRPSDFGNVVDAEVVDTQREIEGHRHMEAGKEITPDGESRIPDHTFWPTEVNGRFVCGWTANMTQPRCGLSKEQHGKPHG